MRSFFALGALALSGSLELAAAANCRPSGTTTSAAPSSSETGSSGGNKVVRNLVSNGGCNELNPNDPSDIPNFYIEGDGRGVTGQGYTGGGSKETNCASLTANATPRRKRAVGPSVTISQDFSDLGTDTFYTIQFFYRITSHPSNGACLLTAFLGESQFYSEYVSDSQTKWNKVLQRTMPTQEISAISIKMTCEGDDATILVDSIFVSNAVTPETIDDYVLDFGDGDAQQTDTATGSVTASETAVETASETDVQTEESATETTNATTIIETYATKTSAGEATTAEETSGFETTTVAEASSTAETSTADETTSVEETSAVETSTTEAESTTVTSAASETTSATEEEEESTTVPSATETTSAAEEEDQTTTVSDIEWGSGGEEAGMMEWSNLDCFVCDETCIVTDN